MNIQDLKPNLNHLPNNRLDEIVIDLQANRQKFHDESRTKKRKKPTPKPIQVNKLSPAESLALLNLFKAHAKGKVVTPKKVRRAKVIVHKRDPEFIWEADGNKYSIRICNNITENAKRIKEVNTRWKKDTYYHWLFHAVFYNQQDVLAGIKDSHPTYPHEDPNNHLPF